MDPKRISHFEILGRLGSGAMGVVYRARDTLLGREVALKIVRPELAGDRRARDRFLRECRAAAAINHPGIATIYEAGESAESGEPGQGQLFLACELVSGESLADRIARGPLPVDQVIDLGIQLARALAAAHERGIIHRDIKPANLMIQNDGRLRVLDFGLARLLRPDDDTTDGDARQTATQTRAGVAVGTPAFMSPEQASGAPVDARTDLFAVGGVLYAAASGRQPFLARSVPETIRRILCEDPPPLESLDPAIPIELCEIIRKSLAKDPAARFASAAELTEALEAIRSDPATTSRRRLSGARVRRRRGLWAALAAAVALGAAAWFSVDLIRGPRFDFASRDRLLIASVENMTGDQAFDLALRTALEADLQQSRYASVIGPSQVGETLRLMRLDPSTPVDEKLGRDVCRFAGIRALLVPRILSAGEAYELQAILIDPRTGRHVDRFRVTARGREEVLLHAVDDLARRVRTRLGESLQSIEKADQPVTDVTTSSWEALSYLAQSQVSWQEQKFKEAAAMLELALEKDPNFATAKGSLGLLLIQFLGEPERGKRLLREALADSDGLPERERLMIRAVNRQFVDQDPEGALEEYAVISELYPDLMQAPNNSGRILAALGRYDEAIDEYREAAHRDPHSSIPLVNLFWLYQGTLHRLDDAESVARKLMTLSPESVDFRNMLAWNLICQGRLEEAVPELRQVVQEEPRHPYGLPNAAHVLYITGREAEAVPLYRRQLQMIEQGLSSAMRFVTVRDLALSLRAVGQTQESRSLACDELDREDRADEETNVDALLDDAELAVLCGREDDARARLARAREAGIDDATQGVSLACVLALLGREDEAFEAVRASLAAGYDNPHLLLIIDPLRPLHEDGRLLALVREATEAG